MYPANAVEPHTDWSKRMKKSFYFSMFVHFGFFVLSLSVIGFEFMTYNLLLGLLCYSAMLTFSLCTIYFYFFNLISALSAGITWALNYREYGSGGSKRGLSDF